MEAENFFELKGPGAKLDLLAVGGGAGFAVGGLRHGSSLHYPNVRGLPTGGSEVVLRMARPEGATPGVRVVVYNATAGSRQQLGDCAMGSTSSWAAFREVRCCRLGAAALVHLVLEVEVEGATGSGRGAEEALRLDSLTIRAIPGAHAEY